MAFRALLAQTVTAARHRKMLPFALVVFTAATAGAAFAGFWLCAAVRIPYHSRSGIVGWVSLHHYSKAQELFDLVVAAVGLPASLLASWWAWIAGATWGARFARCAPSRLLKLFSLASAGMFALVLPLLQMDVTSLRPLLLALSGVALACLGFLVLVRVFGAKITTLPCTTDVAHKTAEPLPRLAPAPAYGSRPALQRTFVWFALPVLVYGLSFENRLNNSLDHFNQFHEGERLYPTWVMRHGGVLYRDVHLQHGLFRNALVPRIGAALYGPTLEGQRRIEDIVWPLGVLSIYVAGATLLASRPLSALILALLLLSSPVEIPERVFLPGLSLAMMALAIRRSDLLSLQRPPDPRVPRGPRRQSLERLLRQGWALMIAGALASLAFWTSVETGLFTWAGMLVFLTVGAALAPGGGVRARMRPLAAFALGACAGFCVVGVYLAAQGALVDAFRNIYQQCAYQAETWGLAFPNLHDTPPLRNEAGKLAWREFLRTESVQMYFPLVTLLLAEAVLVGLWVRKRLWSSVRGWQLLLVTCVGLCFARGLLGRSDGQHLYNGLVFQLLLWALALDALLGSARSRAAALAAALLANPRRRRLVPLLGLLGALLALALALKLVGETYQPLQALKRRAPLAWTSLGDVLARSSIPEPFPGAGRLAVPNEDVDRVQRSVAFIREHTQPGEAIINFSNYATLLFFADRPSATRYFLPCYAATAALQREAIAEIERRRPRLAYRGIGHGFDGAENKERQWALHEYLEAHYEPIGQVEDIEFLWRKGEAR